MLKFKVEVPGLRRAFKKLSIAMSYDDTRFCLVSILFEKRGEEVNFVATDGHKLVVINALNNVDISLTEQGRIDLKNAEDFQYIIPRFVIDEFLQGLKHNFSVVEISFVGGKTINFSYGSDDIQKTYKLMNGKFSYPEWRRVFPSDTKRYTSFNAKYLKQICSVLSLEKGMGIAFESFEGEKGSNLSPSLVTDSTGVKFLIMPMRI